VLRIGLVCQAWRSAAGARGIVPTISFLGPRKIGSALACPCARSSPGVLIGGDWDGAEGRRPRRLPEEATALRVRRETGKGRAMNRRQARLAAVVVMLSAMSAARGSVVNPPPDPPDWWNTEATLHAYAWWEDDIQRELGPYTPVYPSGDAAHWDSDFLDPSLVPVLCGGEDSWAVVIGMDNTGWGDSYKQIFFLFTGTTTDLVNPPSGLGFAIVPLPSGEFVGSTRATNNGDGTWEYRVEGEVSPPSSAFAMVFDVPGLTSVTNVWAGENIPEPAALSILALGGMALIARRRRSP